MKPRIDITDWRGRIHRIGHTPNLIDFSTVTYFFLRVGVRSQVGRKTVRDKTEDARRRRDTGHVRISSRRARRIRGKFTADRNTVDFATSRRQPHAVPQRFGRIHGFIERTYELLNGRSENQTIITTDVVFVFSRFVRWNAKSDRESNRSTDDGYIDNTFW